MRAAVLKSTLRITYNLYSNTGQMFSYSCFSYNFVQVLVCPRSHL